jgi:putative ABC transport system permease protein
MGFLAIKSFLGDYGKFLTSLLGVSFAVGLINLQGGLLLGMLEQSSLLIDYGEADIWVGHRFMDNLDIGNPIPERWVHRLRGIEGVDRAEPYLVMFSRFQTPDGHLESVIVVGCDTDSLLGNAWAMAEGDRRAIRHPDGILAPVEDLDKLGNCKLGGTYELNNHRARIVGLTRGLVSFTTSPYICTSLRRAQTKYVDPPVPGYCSYFLIRAKPGTDIPALMRRIKARVPELAVYAKREFAIMSMTYWLTRTGLGISFGLAAFLGLLIGLAVVVQTMFAAVTERVKEFATLKALGAADPCLAWFILAQALGNALGGAAVGLLGSWSVGWALNSPRAPIHLTGWVAGLSVGLATLVCLAAAWLPYWRIRRLDPAAVLRS